MLTPQDSTFLLPPSKQLAPCASRPTSAQSCPCSEDRASTAAPTDEGHIRDEQPLSPRSCRDDKFLENVSRPSSRGTCVSSRPPSAQSGLCPAKSPDYGMWLGDVSTDLDVTRSDMTLQAQAPTFTPRPYPTTTNETKLTADAPVFVSGLDPLSDCRSSSAATAPYDLRNAWPHYYPGSYLPPSLGCPLITPDHKKVPLASRASTLPNSVVGDANCWMGPSYPSAFFGMHPHEEDLQDPCGSRASGLEDFFPGKMVYAPPPSMDPSLWRAVGGSADEAGGPLVPSFPSDDIFCCAHELKGRVTELSQIQSGSRYLQRQLSKGHPETVMLILQEVYNEITGLMTDPYGNYLCQQLFQTCSVRQRKKMLEKLAPNVIKIAYDRRGTHALQALIALLSTPDEESILVSEIKDKVVELSTDPNGTHVVQRMLLCFSPESTECIIEPIIENLGELALSPYGLCVVKKCMTTSRSDVHIRGLLMGLAKESVDLVQSPYGNYAVQHAFSVWGGAVCRPVLASLRGKILQLSVQKFSSNVVERCIEVAPPDLRAAFVEELIEFDKMAVLIQSSYGIYVVQKALDYVEPAQSESLAKAIQLNLRSIPNKRLRHKWERMMNAACNLSMKQTSLPPIAWGRCPPPVLDLSRKSHQ